MGNIYEEMENRGLSYSDLNEILQYIEKHNSWKNIGEVLETKCRLIKYVSFNMDTRTCRVWFIKFQNGANWDEFRTERDYDLKTRIYEYLNEEVRDICLKKR